MSRWKRHSLDGFSGPDQAPYSPLRARPTSQARQQTSPIAVLGHQIGRLALVARIFVRADVGVRPAVEAALLDVGEVIGHQVVAQGVALLHGGPQRIGSRIPMQPDGIARAGGVGLMTAAIRIVAVDGGAHGVLAGRYIGARADADIQLLARAIEQQAARPVAVTESLQRNHFLARAGGHGFGIVLIALDGLRLAHIEILVPQAPIHKGGPGR